MVCLQEMMMMIKKNIKTFGKESYYNVFSQYTQWLGKTLSDMYNLYNLTWNNLGEAGAVHVAPLSHLTFNITFLKSV